ncbi:MAG: bifunctional diguanylate cyclase/phosphodiesterase [Cyanobacteria bacterium P01_D01_bin.1]
MSLFSSTHRLGNRLGSFQVSVRERFSIYSCGYGLLLPGITVSIPGIAVCAKVSSIINAIQRDAVVAYHPFAELWRGNALAFSYPAFGLGLLTGLFSLMLALLGLRVRRLSSLLKGRDQRIKSILSVDPLTGLVNRTALCAAGDQLLQAQTKSEISLIAFNLNRFKAVNDAFGHGVADELLRQVGQRLQTHLGLQDVLARTGIDEFSLLLNPGDEARTYRIAEQTLVSIHQPFRIQSQLVRVQGRAGIAFDREDQGSQTHDQIQRRLSAKSVSSVSDLLMHANIAMSQVSDGSLQEHQYSVFCPEMKEAIAFNVSLQQSMAAAIEQPQQLEVRYQAIVNIKTGKTVGFEALVRWQHPELGLMSPDDFLPVAEELGLIFRIDRWVLESVCQQLVSWRKKGLSPSVSVNLAGSHLSRADLVEYIHSLLVSYAVEPEQLTLEVTENVMIDNPEQAILTLVQLRDLGVRISLDDFGTGYSSLNYLQQLPVDVLKIDRSFIRCLGQSDRACPVEGPKQSAKGLVKNYPTEFSKASATSRQDELIVKAILSLASALEIRVIVEGVECLAQWQSLQQMDCAYVQGNYFSKAVEADCAWARLLDEL